MIISLLLDVEQMKLSTVKDTEEVHKQKTYFVNVITDQRKDSFVNCRMHRQ